MNRAKMHVSNILDAEFCGIFGMVRTPRVPAVFPRCPPSIIANLRETRAKLKKPRGDGAGRSQSSAFDMQASGLDKLLRGGSAARAADFARGLRLAKRARFRDNLKKA